HAARSDHHPALRRRTVAVGRTVWWWGAAAATRVYGCAVDRGSFQLRSEPAAARDRERVDRHFFLLEVRDELEAIGEERLAHRLQATAHARRLQCQQARRCPDHVEAFVGDPVVCTSDLKRLQLVVHETLLAPVPIRRVYPSPMFHADLRERLARVLRLV